MALEATHIRFALDLKNKYQAKDIKRYIVGTIYPDSRYVSGVDRFLTHPIDFMDWRQKDLDDFKKGWFVHLLADKLQRQVAEEKLPQVFEGEDGQGSEVWIKYTAIKILQDIDDVRKFDIKKYLPYLAFTENPNGEDFDLVNKYNKIFIKMYAEPDEVDIDSCYEMWREFGIGDDLAAKVKKQSEEYSKDERIMNIIREIYSQMIIRVEKLI